METKQKIKVLLLITLFIYPFFMMYALENRLILLLYSFCIPHGLGFGYLIKEEWKKI